MMAGKGHPGTRRVPTETTFREWVAGDNALKFATREQIVAFANMQLRDQIVPLMRNMIIRYDAERRARSLRGRIRRWFRRLLGRPMTPMELQEETILAEDRDRARAEAAPEPQLVVDEEDAEPAPRRRTCVVCGSAKLEPVSELGGLKCENGHILEEPPIPEGNDSGQPAGGGS